MLKRFAPLLVLTLCMACITISFTGCAKEPPLSSVINLPGDTSTIPSQSQFTYLALGDSYTIGQSVAVEDRYPHLTVAALRQLGITVQTPKYIAQTGWPTSALQAAIAQAEPLGTYDIVTLLIGVNDQYQSVDTNSYRERFNSLLLKSTQLAGGKRQRVFVLSIPDYSATPFVSNEYKDVVRLAIDQFNAINKEITLANGVRYIDITSLTRMAATDVTLLANDQLHYSAKEHQQWAELLAPAIKNVLK
jgi:lysophospholipase L1-like esterase